MSIPDDLRFCPIAFLTRSGRGRSSDFVLLNVRVLVGLFEVEADSSIVFCERDKEGAVWLRDLVRDEVRVRVGGRVRFRLLVTEGVSFEQSFVTISAKLLFSPLRDWIKRF